MDTKDQNETSLSYRVPFYATASAIRFLPLHVMCAVLTSVVPGPRHATAQIPDEPVEIARGVPQFFVDDWLVDNRFAIKYKHNAVVHSVDPPKNIRPTRFIAAIAGTSTSLGSRGRGKFQLWTQVHHWVEKPGGRSSRYAIAYAESDDGLKWNAPNLGLFPWQGSRNNNVVIRRPNNARASGPQLLLTLPPQQKRGYAYVMAYRTGGATSTSFTACRSTTASIAEVAFQLPFGVGQIARKLFSCRLASVK